jgi:hypothetical protein
MNTRRHQLHLAHSCPPLQNESEAGEAPAAEVHPEEAAQYIAALLGSLRAIALNAQLTLLSDLLSVAEEEAKFHCRM